MKYKCINYHLYMDTICYILFRIGHDNKGLAPGWHLNEIVINCVVMNKKWSFACNRWLATDEDDGRIELELYPKTKELEEDMTQYVVEVFTGDEKKAGTDSNVYLTIIGTKGDSSEKALEKSETHHNKFERNHVKDLQYGIWFSSIYNYAILISRWIGL